MVTERMGQQEPDLEAGSLWGADMTQERASQRRGEGVGAAEKQDRTAGGREGVRAEPGLEPD